LRERLGSLNKDVVSAAILDVLERGVIPTQVTSPDEDLAIQVPISMEAYARLLTSWEAVSDEHRAQLLLKALS
jgi:hypothetical protein